jgi:hypothetical protein
MELRRMCLRGEEGAETVVLPSLLAVTSWEWQMVMVREKEISWMLSVLKVLLKRPFEPTGPLRFLPYLFFPLALTPLSPLGGCP